MPSQSDVRDALTAQVGSILFPAGLSQPSATGRATDYFAGWPNSEALGKQIAAGGSTVSIYPDPGMSHCVARYNDENEVIAETPGAVTMAPQVIGSVVTIGGAPTVGQVIGLAIGFGNDAAAYSYRIQAGDTNPTIAAAIGAMVPGSIVTGNAIAIPGSPFITVNVVADVAAQYRVTRMRDTFRVIAWSPNPADRDTLGGALFAGLAAIAWLPLPFGLTARMVPQSARPMDTGQGASIYRHDSCFTIEYDVTQTVTLPCVLFVTTNINAVPSVAFGSLAVARPLVGAIRFDGFANASTASGSVASQLATCLSPTAYENRLPYYALVANGGAVWPAMTQATMDGEIATAVYAGLDYWAFDSYQPTDEETLALNLYLASTAQQGLRFCMIGQASNWNLGSAPTYAASLTRDIGLFSNPAYLTALSGRPVYYVLNSGTEQQMAAAIAYIRTTAAPLNPYIIGLNSASLGQYNNVTGWALAAGCDAAGSYSTGPNLNGATQPYSALALGSAADWTARLTQGLPMVPTAMTDFDPDPLIANPPAFYGGIPSGWALGNSFAAGTQQQIAAHIVAASAFARANPAACESGLVLVYAWNELAEGGKGLIPTYQPSNPAGDVSRQIALRAVIPTS